MLMIKRVLNCTTKKLTVLEARYKKEGNQLPKHNLDFQDFFVLTSGFNKKPHTFLFCE